MPRIAAISLTAFTFLLFISCGIFSKEIVIPASRIQETINKKFPYDKNVIFAQFTMDSPQVYLREKSIGLTLHYSGRFLDRAASGLIDFRGVPVFNPEEGAFYVHNFELVDFKIDNGNIAGKDEIKNAVALAANLYLADFPIYQLDKNVYQQDIAGLLLKSVEVRGNNLVLVLGAAKK